MREIRPSGSVRGADREVRPYRDLPKTDAVGSVLFGGSRRYCLQMQTRQGRPEERAAHSD